MHIAITFPKMGVYYSIVYTHRKRSSSALQIPVPFGNWVVIVHVGERRKILFNFLHVSRCKASDILASTILFRIRKKLPGNKAAENYLTMTGNAN